MPDGGPVPRRRNHRWPWGPLLAAVLTLPVAGLLASRSAGLTSRGLVPLTDRAAALTAVCLLLVPLVLDRRVRPCARRSLAGLSLAALAAGLLALALPILLGRPVAHPGPLLAGALMVGVGTFVIGAMARLLLPLAGDPTAALGWVLLTALVLATAPLWLAEPLAGGAPIADLLVAVNPLTALGLCGSIDYPRDAWLYRHSPLGGVRYRYPSLASLSLCYLSTGMAALALAHRTEGRVGRAAVRPDRASANPVETLP